MVEVLATQHLSHWDLVVHENLNSMNWYKPASSTNRWEKQVWDGLISEFKWESKESLTRHYIAYIYEVGKKR